MKFSNNFNKSYDSYINLIGIFDFCGTISPTFEAIKNGNKSAKECFYFIESQGKNYPCFEPELLNKILFTKASINFQIKQWAECRAEGTLPLMEFSKRLAYDKYGTSFTDFHVLEWVNGEPVYFDDIESQFNLPGWVLRAVENQAISIRKNKFTSH
jgi:hypothetical protein